MENNVYKYSFFGLAHCTTMRVDTAFCCQNFLPLDYKRIKSKLACLVCEIVALIHLGHLNERYGENLVTILHLVIESRGKVRGSTFEF